MFCARRLSSGSEQVNSPVSGQSLLHDHAHQAVQRGLFLQAADLHVLKSVIGERRLKRLLRVTAERVAIELDPVIADHQEIAQEDRPVRIAHLAVLQLDGLTGLAAELEAAVTDHVLVEREDMHARPDLGDRDRLEFPRRPDRLPALPDQLPDFQIGAPRLQRQPL